MASDKYMQAYLKSLKDPLPELAEAFKAELSFFAKYINKIGKDNNDILDLGCGNGRVISRLGRKFRYSYFLGMDNNPMILEYAMKKRRINVDFDIGDALNTKLHRGYDMTFTAYNVIGIFNEKDLERLVKEESRITNQDGYILNTTMCTDDYTRELSERFYSDLDFHYKRLDNFKVVTKDMTFRRVPISELASAYEKAGIDILEVTKLGQIFMGIAGRKK